jgi:hypothetical protein
LSRLCGKTQLGGLLFISKIKTNIKKKKKRKHKNNVVQEFELEFELELELFVDTNIVAGTGADVVIFNLGFV